MNQAIATKNAPAAIGPYSQGIKAGKTIYVLDMDLNILYSVSCGGIIISYWPDGKGNLFLITSKYHWTMPYNYKADSVIKLQKFQLGHAKQPNTVKKKADKKAEIYEHYHGKNKGGYE